MNKQKWKSRLQRRWWLLENDLHAIWRRNVYPTNFLFLDANLLFESQLSLLNQLSWIDSFFLYLGQCFSSSPRSQTGYLASYRRCCCHCSFSLSSSSSLLLLVTFTFSFLPALALINPSSIVSPSSNRCAQMNVCVRQSKFYPLTVILFHSLNGHLTALCVLYVSLEFSFLHSYSCCRRRPFITLFVSL